MRFRFFLSMPGLCHADMTRLPDHAAPFRCGHGNQPPALPTGFFTVDIEVLQSFTWTYASPEIDPVAGRLPHRARLLLRFRRRDSLPFPGKTLRGPQTALGRAIKHRIEERGGELNGGIEREEITARWNTPRYGRIQAVPRFRWCEERCSGEAPVFPFGRNGL